MNIVTACAFPLSVIGVAAGILGAYGLRFPMLPELLAEFFSIALATMLLTSGLALSKNVANTVRIGYEGYVQRRYPAAEWLWRRDWRKRVSRAETISSTNPFPTWFLLGVVALVIVLAVRYSPSARLTLGSMGATMIVMWCVVLMGVAAVCKHANNLNVLRFLIYPITAGGYASFTLSADRRGKLEQLETSLVCEQIVIQPHQRGRRKVSSERLHEIWRSSSTPNVVLENHKVCISMRFELPSDAMPTSRNHNSMVKWRVMVRGMSRTGEVFYERSFVVPVTAASRATTDMCWDRIQTPTTDHEFDDLDNILTARADRFSNRNTFDDGPIWRGLAEGLAAGQITLSRDGICYGERVWRKSPTFTRAIWGCAAWTGGLFALAGIALANTTWTLAIELSYLTALIGAVIGFAQSLYFVFHRFDLEFDSNALLVRHRCLGKRWKRAIPWPLFETVTWERLEVNGHTHRRIVVNPDDSRGRRVLSPPLCDGLLVDNLIDALELCRAIHRSVENPVQISWPAPQAWILDSAQIPGYSPSP